MWIRFLRFSKKIFPDRRAFYYPAGSSCDLPPEWCEDWLADGSAAIVAPPDAPAIVAELLPPSIGDGVLSVACVHKLGNSTYDRNNYVGALADAVARNLSTPHRFVCLTDAVSVPDGVERIPLLHGWRGFWSKLEVFRPGLFDGPVLYLDLDTIVCGDITDIANVDSPLALSWDMNRGWINSSFMRWSVDMSFIYRALADAPDHASAIAKYECGYGRWGDQGLLQDTLEARGCGWNWIQDLFPERINWHPPANRDKPALPGTSISLWYGHPKPHEVSTDFVAAHWRPKARQLLA